MWTKLKKICEEAKKEWPLSNNDLLDLIENATDEEINELDVLNRNILCNAIMKGWDLRICELIISKMEPNILNGRTNYNINPNYFTSGNKFLIPSNGRDATVLHVALMYKNRILFKILLDKMNKQSVCAKDQFGGTILHLAAELGRVKECKLIYNKYPELLYTLNRFDGTCLHYAAHKCRSKVCEYLLSIDPNLSSYISVGQDTPLLLALKTNSPLDKKLNKNLNKTCEVLIKNMNAESLNHKEYNRKALDIAIKNGHKEIENILKMILSKE